MSGPANLIPLQLDQTTGNLVAKQIPGIYVPPSGTGFQYVTNGTPNTSAVTPTQATALLNIFTASLQGLVPASGGGTSNFLRADGTWASPILSTVVTSFNTRTGAVTLTSADIGTALGYVAYNGVANPSGFLSTAVTSAIAGTGIGVSAATGAVTFSNTGVVSFNTRTGAVTLTSGDVTGALGFTPYNATNPAGYISANQTITLSGDISGTGTTTIVTTLPSIVAAGGPGIVSWNAKGQVVSGSSPTTLAGYGITDGVATDVSSNMASGISITFSGGGTVTGLPTPVNPTDVANKTYVDSAIAGLSWKEAVEAVAVTNQTLTGPATIDGYVVQNGDRILIAGQTNNTQNGIYIANTTGAWTRSTDANTPAELNGAAALVQQGSVYANTQWTQTQQVTAIGTSPIIFVQFSTSGGGTVTSVAVSGSNGIGVTGSPITTAGTIALSLGAITPTSVAATGTVTGTNLSGTNTGDQTITLTGDVSGSGTGSFAATLATVNANVGTFGSSTNVATITVNAKGLVTAASNTAITFPVTSVFGRTGAVTAQANDYSFAQLSGSATTAQLPALSASGDASGTGTAGTGNIPLTLATVNANVGTFTNATVTVNAKGLITAASSGSAGSGTVTSVAASSSTLTITGSPITTSGTLVINLPTQGGLTPGSYTNTNLTVDAQGRITAAANGSAGTGTVTSVALADGSTTPIYSITGSPVTTSGTLTQTLTTQTANTVFAGPASGAAAQPTFRALSVKNVLTTTGDVPSGVERVVWQYQASNTNSFNTSTPTATTSGVSVSGVVAATATATYNFTGYDHPPVSMIAYGQQTNTPTAGTTQWITTDVAGYFPTIADTGTNAVPNLLTSFTSSNGITFSANGSNTQATDSAGTGAYLILEFKF